MQLTVIIPTFNRAYILRECLEAIEHQDLPQKDFEVIVVDDGSKDDTPDVVDSFKGKIHHLYYFRQENQGQGIARNSAVQKARGNVAVIINDDIIVREDFLSQHLRFHLRFPYEHEAVLGFTDWHPKLTRTPFMDWLTNGSTVMGRFGGHQFAYEKLKGKIEADYNFFYTSNISLKRSLLEQYPFDPAFSGYGWEDIELGYRLHKRAGLRLYYNPDAIGYHDHAMTEESLPVRMRSIGKSAWIFHHKYPELQKVPSWTKRFAFWLLSNQVSLGILRLLRNITQGKFTNLYYYALSKKYFMEGLRERLDYDGSSQ